MEEKIIEILNSLKPGADFAASADLLGDGLIDSFAMINLVSELEDEFDVEIGAQNIIKENFKTVKAIADMITRLADED